VQAYLEAYCKIFELLPFVRLNTIVNNITPLPATTPPRPDFSLQDGASPHGPLGTEDTVPGGLGSGAADIRWRVTSSTCGTPEVRFSPHVVNPKTGHLWPFFQLLPGFGVDGSRVLTL
jgi:hypothetical protein